MAIPAVIWGIGALLALAATGCGRRKEEPAAPEAPAEPPRVGIDPNTLAHFFAARAHGCNRLGRFASPEWLAHQPDEGCGLLRIDPGVEGLKIPHDLKPDLDPGTVRELPGPAMIDTDLLRASPNRAILGKIGRQKTSISWIEAYEATTGGRVPIPELILKGGVPFTLSYAGTNADGRLSFGSLVADAARVVFTINDPGSHHTRAFEYDFQAMTRRSVPSEQMPRVFCHGEAAGDNLIARASPEFAGNHRALALLHQFCEQYTDYRRGTLSPLDTARLDTVRDFMRTAGEVILALEQASCQQLAVRGDSPDSAP